MTHVCIVLSDFLDVLYASCFCLKQELVFSLLYDDIDLLLAVIVLNQSGVKLKLVKLKYVSESKLVVTVLLVYLGPRKLFFILNV